MAKATLEVLIKTTFSGKGLQDATRGLDSAEKRVSKVSTNAGTLTKALGAAGVAGAFATATAAAVQFGQASLQSFQEFETGFNEVATLLPDFSDQALSQLREDTLAFSQELGRVPQEVLPALYQALSAGVPPDNVFAFLEQANATAIAGVSDLATSVDVLTGISNATASLGENALTTAQASDILFSTINDGKTTLPEISAEISDLTKAGVALNIPFQDSAAAFATLTTVIGNSAESATQYKSLIDELSKSNSLANQTFQELTGTGVRQFIQAGGTLEEILSTLQQEANDSNVAISEFFGSSEAGGAALILAGGSAETFAENLDAARNATGATQTAVENFSDSLAESERQANAATEALRIQVGEALSPSRQAWFELTESVANYASSVLETRQANIDLGRALGDLDFNNGLFIISAINKRLEESTVTTDEFISTLNELAPTFEGTRNELIDAAFDLAEQEARLNSASERWEAYGQRLQEIEQAELAAKLAREDNTDSIAAAQDQLQSYDETVADSITLSEEQTNLLAETTQALREGTITRAQAEQILQEGLGTRRGLVNLLDAEITRQDALVSPLERVISAREADALAAENEARAIQELNDALDQQARRTGATFSAFFDTSGGGSAESLAEREAKAAQELTDQIVENQERIAEAVEEGEERVTKARQDGILAVAEAQAEAAQIIADAEQALADARTQALADFESEVAETFSESVAAVLEEEVKTTEELTQELFDLSQQSGATVSQLNDLALATGLLTEEQAAAALAATAQRQALEAIAEAYAAGELTAEEAAEAFNTANQQIEEGSEVDLSAFGVELRDANQAIAEGTAEAQQRLIDAQTEAAQTIAQAQADAATALSEAQSEQSALFQEAQAANTAALLEVQQSIAESADAYSGGGRAAETLNQQLLRQAESAGASAEQLAILGFALGEYTTAQVEAALQAVILEEKTRQVAQQFTEGEITATEARDAIVEFSDALREDFVFQIDDDQVTIAQSDLDTLGSTATTVTATEYLLSLDSDVTDRQQELINLQGEIDETSGTYAVNFTTNAGEVEGQVDDLNQAADDAAGERRIIFKVEQQGVIPEDADGGTNTQAITGLATGGRLPTNELVLVGEEGPELVAFDRPGYVIPNDPTNQILGAINNPPSAVGMVDFESAAIMSTVSPVGSSTTGTSVVMGGSTYVFNVPSEDAASLAASDIDRIEQRRINQLMGVM